MSHVPAQEVGQLSILAQILPHRAGRDRGEIAQRLIRHFGSLRTIYSASAAALGEALDGFGDDGLEIVAAIVGARRLADAAARETLQGEPLNTRAVTFRDYLIRRLGSRREECVLVLFLTGRGLFIAEDLYVGGQRGGSRIPLRRSVRRAFDLDARRLVLAHNHPSGVASPSGADISATARLRDVLDALEIGLEDHCIVAGNAVASMRAMNLI